MDTVGQKNKTSAESIKVLVADDDTPTRILLRAAISQWGYEVVEAKDGEEAWQIMQGSEAPQLIILDWLMPKLDGIALCELSKQELVNRPYIILLTQVTGTTNITKGLDAGADEFLSKPFNMAELRSRLSVGARVIHYKTMLSTQTRQLQLCLNHLDECVDITSELIKSSQINSTPLKDKLEILQGELRALISCVDQQTKTNKT